MTRPLALKNKSRAAFVPTKRGAKKEEVKEVKEQKGNRRGRGKIGMFRSCKK